MKKLLPSYLQTKPILLGLALLASLIFFSACASTKTQQNQYAESVPLVQQGNYKQAASIIEQARTKSYKEKDRVLYYLDLGMLLHWAGEWERSNEMLDQAEFAIEELYTKSISKGAASVVLNDNALDYPGEDYEDIYLNVFKALNYIALENIESAQVETRRVQIKLNILEDKYKKLVEEYNDTNDQKASLKARESQFHNDVLARYLSLLLYRSEGAVDDARIDLEAINEAWKTQPQLYSFSQPSPPAIEESSDGHALVNIVSFSGLGPVKLADTLYISSTGDALILTMQNQDKDYVNNLVGLTAIPMVGVGPGLGTKLQFPRMETRQSKVDRIVVKFNGNPIAELSMLENMEVVAQETFLLKLPLTIGRTIVRMVAKIITKEVGKAVLYDQLGELGGFLSGLAVDAAVMASENADLRIAQFFPAYARAVEVSVEPGTYNVQVEYWEGGSLLGVTEHGNREFQPGRLNFVESYLLL